MALRKLAIATALVLTAFAAAPAKASADWLFTPFVGMNWGGSAGFNEAGTDFDDEFERKVNFGAQLSWMGAGALGFEVDFGYAPNFFESTAGDGDFDYGDSNVTTLMANLKVGAPFGGQTGGGIRPYASGGIGIIKSRIDDADDLFNVDSTNWGLNVGGGVAGFFSDNVGVQGDIRYFRSLEDTEAGGEDDFNVGLGSFSFWRGTVGLVFRF
jgi:opacity protein-like surface antigen